MSEMLMTDEAATTTEGQAVSQGDAQESTQVEEGSSSQQGSEESDFDATANGVIGAPEAYDLEVDTEDRIDADTLGKFKEVARDLNLSNQAAQKIIDEMAPKFREQQEEQIEFLRNEWAAASRADKEFGGAEFDKNLGLAAGALKQFGTDELRGLLSKSGLGNHPEVIRMLVKVGKATSADDKLVSGRAVASKVEGRDAYAAMLYPSQQT